MFVVARAENAVLQKRVQELSAQVQQLRLQNQVLQAEVEIYRQEAATTTTALSNLALGNNNNNNNNKTSAPDSLLPSPVDSYNYSTTTTAFIKSGNGTFPSENQVTLSNLHGRSNPSCCALSADDTVLATGGADHCLRLVSWGLAWTNTTATNHNGENNPAAAAANDVVEHHVTALPCAAPVICVAFCLTDSIVAAGSMDGVVHLWHYRRTVTTGTKNNNNNKPPPLQVTPIGVGNDESSSTRIIQQHTKYVRTVAWAPQQPILATSSADGTVHLYQVTKAPARSGETTTTTTDSDYYQVTRRTSLHLTGPVEALCFTLHHLVCFARGTPYLSYFDGHTFELTHRVNLNTNNNTTTTRSSSSNNTVGAFTDEHVSFCIMDLAVSPCGRYLAAATDASRNLILDAGTGQVLRSLYGHQNDGYSQPKLAWSRNGQYLAGNTQHDAELVVWDIASSQIVQRLVATTTTGSGGSSARPIRDLRAGHGMDCWVTTSFDKHTRLWFAPS